MEERGTIGKTILDRVHILCVSLSNSAASLVNGVSGLTRESVHELTLLTLGPQLRGSILNAFGDNATSPIFALSSAKVCYPGSAFGYR
jgi:hypothetical protein